MGGETVMANEGGSWIMHGVARDSRECLHTAEEAIKYIREMGFLPLFKNEIPGFSMEEHTAPEHWWCGDPAVDPWVWREVIARAGYDFDALWDDEKASRRQKKIMDLFAEEHADDELYSFEIRQRAGFGKKAAGDGEKNFEGTITELQMQMYLCMRDFRRRKNKMGQEYGWNVAVYSTPEHLFGQDLVTAAYKELPSESGDRIYTRIRELYPAAAEKQIKKILL